MSWHESKETEEKLICVPCALRKQAEIPPRVQFWLEDYCDFCGRITQVCKLSEFGFCPTGLQGPHDSYKFTDS